ncbi:MAG: cbb3-type cytochrome c oxidase subunit 3 [bacterium]
MYEFLSQFAQTFGLLFFIIAFGLVLLYALAPSNKDKFNHAARLPLEECDDDE